MLHPIFISALIVSLAATVALLSMIVMLGFKNKTARGNPIPSPDEMRPHAMWYMFYVNPQDPRGWVPKLRGYGYTVNFRCKLFAKIFAIALIAVMACTVVLIVYRPR